MFPIRMQTATKKKRKRLSHVLEDLTMMQRATVEHQVGFFHDNNNTKENRKMMQENGTDKPKHVNVPNLVPLAHLQNIMSPSTSDQHQEKSINAEQNGKSRSLPDLTMSQVKDLTIMQMAAFQHQFNYFHNNNNTKEMKEESPLMYMPSLFPLGHVRNSMSPSTSTSSIVGDEKQEKSGRKRSGKADSLSDSDIVHEKDLMMAQRTDFRRQLNYFHDNNNTKESVKIKKENCTDEQMNNDDPDIVPMEHLQKIMFSSTSPLLADQDRSIDAENSAKNFCDLAISQFNNEDTPLDLSMKKNAGGLLDMFFPPMLPLGLFHMQGSLSVPIVHGDVASSTTVESVASRYNLDVCPVVEEMPPGSDAAVVCPICGQMFSLQHRLTKHMASKHKTKHVNNPESSTSKSYNCEICVRKFTRSDMLTRHMRLHTGQKPYNCKVCGQVFSRSDHLSTHNRTHTGEKPYKCPQCAYAACRRDMITRHLKTHSMRGSSRGSLHGSSEENSANMSP